MTPQQQQILDLVKQVNDRDFASWFNPSEVMAFCQIESAFRPHAYRYESRLGEGSYGLMQVLASTARQVDANITNPEMMYDPEIGLRTGMKVAKVYWEQLTGRLNRDPSYEEWADSYNRGVGGVLRDLSAVDDHAYPQAWDNAQSYWEAQGVDG